MMREAWPGLSGCFRSGAHVLPLRVYFEDTDAGGVVYHARYVVFCERARSDYLRLLDIHQSEFAEVKFVVRRMLCDFLRPARLDDLLEVHTRFLETAGARAEIAQEVRLDGEVLFKAQVTVALVDAAGRPKRLPAEMVDRLRQLPES